MTITFAIALVAVLALSGTYLIWQWRTGVLLAAVDDVHQCYDEGYDQGASDGDDTGYGRGRADEKVDGTEPLRDALQGVADLWPASRHQGNIEGDDWRAIAEEMYEKATAAL